MTWCNCKIHLVQGLLHLLHMNRSHLNQAVTVPQDGAHRANLLVWTKGGFEKANGMKVLNFH
jgi:hypothetical protein